MKKTLVFLLVIAIVFCVEVDDEYEDVILQKFRIKNPIKKVVKPIKKVVEPIKKVVKPVKKVVEPVKKVVEKPLKGIADIVKLPKKTISNIVNKVKQPIKKIKGTILNLIKTGLALLGGQPNIDENELMEQFYEMAKPLCIEFCVAFGPEDVCNQMAEQVFDELRNELKN